MTLVLGHSGFSWCRRVRVGSSQGKDPLPAYSKSWSGFECSLHRVGMLQELFCALFSLEGGAGGYRGEGVVTVYFCASLFTDIEIKHNLV